MWADDADLYSFRGLGVPHVWAVVPKLFYSLQPPARRLSAMYLCPPCPLSWMGTPRNVSQNVPRHHGATLVVSLSTAVRVKTPSSCSWPQTGGEYCAQLVMTPHNVLVLHSGRTPRSSSSCRGEHPGVIRPGQVRAIFRMVPGTHVSVGEIVLVGTRYCLHPLRSS